VFEQCVVAVGLQHEVVREEDAATAAVAEVETQPVADSDVAAADKTQKPAENKAATGNAKKNKPKQEEMKKTAPRRESSKDAEALNLVKKYHTFGRNTPAFLLTAVELAEDD
jgi:hypothetical protein